MSRSRIIAIVLICGLLILTALIFFCLRAEKTPYEQIEARLKGKSQSQRIEYLIETFEEKDDRSTIEVVVYFLSKEKATAVPSLIEQLKKQKDEKKEYAMLALQTIGEPAINPLIDLFDDELLRKDIQAILIVMGRETLEPLLLKLNQSEEKEEKMALIETITFLSVSNEEAVRSMLKIFSDENENEEIRIKALTCLLLFSKDIEKTLEKISKEDKGTLGETASLILEKIKEENL